MFTFQEPCNKFFLPCNTFQISLYTASAIALIQNDRFRMNYGTGTEHESIQEDEIYLFIKLILKYRQIIVSNML